MFKDKIKIGSLELNSRIVMPPMATYYSQDNSVVSDALVMYYAERAKNRNLGLIITEHNYIEASGCANPGQMSIASDEDLHGLKMK